MTHDVLIVGGGPAGLASAIALGERGLSVALCEPRVAPDKACGEGIMPTGVAALARLGVLPLLERAAPFVGIRFLLPDGSSAAARFREGPGLVVRRPELGRALQARLEQLPNVELVRAAVDEVTRDLRRIRVRVGGRWLDGRLLIGADGARSRIRRWAGLEPVRQAASERWGARQHFRARPWTDHVEVFFEDGLEAYVSHSGPEQIGVAILWHRKRRRLGGGSELVRNALAHFPLLAQRLGGAEPASAQLAVGPLERSARAAHADGVLLVGDAAGYLDAITGEGLSLALCAAADLADPLAAAVAEGRNEDGVVSRALLGPAARQHGRLRQRNRWVTRALLSLSRRPRLLSYVVEGLAREPAVFQHFLSANMGLVSPFVPPPRASLKLLFGLGRAGDAAGELPLGPPRARA